MRVLPVLSVIGLAAAAGGVAWSIFARPADVFITHEVADSFDFQAAPAPRAPAAPRAAAQEAPSSLTRPLAEAGMASSVPAAPAAAPVTSVSPKARDWAVKQISVARLMASGSLGSASGVRAFLGDQKRVDAYMNSTLVRITLGSPVVAKALLGNSTLVGAFLATPALRDPKTVDALMASPMVKKMLDCPAIQQALGDPAVVRRILEDPGALAWAAAHPGALIALSGAAPSLGAAVSARTGR